MKKLITGALAGFFLLGMFVFPPNPWAAPYYEGKVITILVGFSPGAHVDGVGRMLARHLPKYIPGKPTIIVQNMPGAGSRMAANYLYEQAAPDGLTIGTFSRGFPLVELLFGPKGTKDPGIRFDLMKYSWIGSPLVESEIFAIRSDLPYKTFDDLLKAKEPINVGLTTVGGAETNFFGPLKDYLGLKLNMILYPGAADIYLAMERKELDGRAGTYSSLKPYIARGFVRPVLRGVASEPGLENVPVNINYTTDERVKAVMRVVSSVDPLGQPYVAPPNTPAHIMTLLREGFSKWTADPQVQEEAKKRMFGVKYVTAEESLQIVRYILNQPPEITSILSKYTK